MKKTTKTISIVLCLIMIFTAIPLNAFAGAPIYGIGLTFDTNIHGESIENYKEFITINYGEVDFYSEDDSLPVTATPIDGSVFNGTFEGGKTYEVSICFAAKNGSYYFMPSLPNSVSFSDTSIVCNEYTVTLKQYGTDYVTVYAEVTIDKPTIFQQISDFFATFFENFKNFFLELFSFK